jgi:hypothetical protein
MYPASFHLTEFHLSIAADDAAVLSPFVLALTRI